MAIRNQFEKRAKTIRDVILFLLVCSMLIYSFKDIRKTLTSLSHSLFGRKNNEQVVKIESQVMKDIEIANKFKESGKRKQGIEAISDYNKAIELNSLDYEAYHLRAIAKYLLQDYRGAIVDLDREISIGPKYFGKYSMRADCKLALRQYQDAMVDYNIAVEIAREDGSDVSYTLKERGKAKYQMRDYKGAIDDYNQALFSDSERAETYFHRGLAKLSLGKKNDGCLDLSMAGELGSSEAYKYIRQYCN